MTVPFWQGPPADLVKARTRLEEAQAKGELRPGLVLLDDTVYVEIDYRQGLSSEQVTLEIVKASEP